VGLILSLNADIAGRLDEVAQILAEQGANRFRVQAYHHAGNVLRNLPHSVSDIFAVTGRSSITRATWYGSAFRVTTRF